MPRQEKPEVMAPGSKTDSKVSRDTSNVALNGDKVNEKKDIEQAISDIKSLPKKDDIERVASILNQIRGPLQGLEGIDREITREKLIKATGKRLSSPARVIDLYLPRRKIKQTDSQQDGEIELYPGPVDGSDIVIETLEFIIRFVDLPKNLVVAVVLWIFHSFCFEIGEFSPRLLLRSPTKRCGKTTLKDVIGMLVNRPQSTENASTAVLFRLIEASQPTLLIDEGDTFLNANEEMRGILNAGFKKGGTVLRCVGDEHEVKGFNVYCPTLLSMIGRPPSTIKDRSIDIELQRKSPGKKFDSLRMYKAQALELKSKIARWVRDNKQEIEHQLDTQGLPYCENDRALDSWEIMIAIARTAGHYDLAEKSFRFIELRDDEEDDEVSIHLLSDIKHVFVCEKMFSKELVGELISIEGSMWSEPYYGKPFSQNRLAKILSPFGIRPKTIRIGSDTKKGYEKIWFKDTWKRYLSTVPSSDSTHLNRNIRNTTDIIDEYEFSNRNKIPIVTDTKPDLYTCNYTDVTVVADENGSDREGAYRIRGSI